MYDQVQIGKYCSKVGTIGNIKNDSNYLYIDISSIDREEKKIFSEIEINSQNQPSRAKQVTQTGDILVSTVRPNLNAVAQVGNKYNNQIASTGYCVLRPLEDKLLSKYLFHWVRTDAFIDDMVKRSSGASYPAVSDKIVKSSKIPLPPLPIQQKIAEVLDRADALRQRNRQIMRRYDQLAQSVFLDMFGDPVKNPKGWPVKSTIKLASSIVPGRDKPKSFTGDTPWVTTDDLNHLGLTFGSKKDIGLTENEIEEVNAKLIPANSVIMTCVGDLGVVSINKEEIIINQQLHAFQCKEELAPIFLMYNLSLQRPYFFKMATNTTVPYLNKTKCNNTPCIVPPIDLQDRFSQIIMRIETQKQKQQQELEKSEELFQSLLQRAFKGDLFPEKLEKGQMAMF